MFNNNMNPVIQKIIENIALIEETANKWLKKPNLRGNSLTRGFDVSARVTAQPTEVAMTPIMKAMLEYFGDLDPNNPKSRLMVDSPITKAEKGVQDVTAKALQLYNHGVSSNLYDRNLEVDDYNLYDTDCFDNAKTDIKMRDIQPGQAEENLENTVVYGTLTDDFDMKSKLQKDIILQKTVLMILKVLPEVRASEEFREVNLPFMTKHTNVGYPSGANDRARVPGTDMTYAEETMHIAEQMDLGDTFNGNVSTLFTRNQRGKGRTLIAISRPANLQLNRLESEEIAAYKAKCPLFAGYNDDIFLKEVLTKMNSDCKTYNLRCANWDQSKFDQHVSKPGMLLLGAISIYLANGQRSKEIALVRACLAMKTWLVNGLSGKFEEVYGRIFSGFIDTNRGGGIINAIITLYCCMQQDPDYSSLWYRLQYYMLVMGDDNLFIYSELDEEKYVQAMKNLGFEVNPDKQQYGLFFLQNRLFKPKDSSDLVMAYPGTRVLRSMLFKETGKGLGPYGGVLAMGQQLYKLIQVPQYLAIVVNIILPFDKCRLGIDLSVDEILAKVQEEDGLARKKKANAQSTADILYDGDPTKAIQFNSDGTLSFDYLHRIQDAIKQAVNPDVLQRLGVSVPTVRKNS